MTRSLQDFPYPCPLTWRARTVVSSCTARPSAAILSPAARLADSAARLRVRSAAAAAAASACSRTRLSDVSPVRRCGCRSRQAGRREEEKGD